MLALMFMRTVVIIAIILRQSHCLPESRRAGEDKIKIWENTIQLT